jgi:hypothetical protein
MQLTFALLMLAAVCFAGCSSTKTQTSPKAWEAVAEGMMRREIVTRIGPPAAGSPFNDLWRNDGWELRVDFDRGGRATNVVRTFILR